MNVFFGERGRNRRGYVSFTICDTCIVSRRSAEAARRSRSEKNISSKT